MDFSKLIERARRLLTAPKSEWPVIAGEATTLKDLYVPWVLVLAAIPAVAGFIKGSLIGYGALGVTLRTPIGAGLGNMLLGYGLSLVLLYVVALVIDALAPTFDGQKNRTQALKTACYAWTAAWIAGVGMLVPWLGWLIAIAGGVYSIYLLYLGLPHTMQCPVERAGGYTAASVVIAVVLSFVMGLLLAGVTGGSPAKRLAASGAGSPQVSIDSDSKLGALVALGKRMEEAGKQAEAAKTGDDSQDAAAAMQAMTAAMSGGKDGKPVESLTPDELKTFLPATLAGLERSRLEAERQSGMGVQITNASAVYASADGKRRLKVSLADMPSMHGAMAFANVFASESEKQTADGYEKTYQSNGQRIHEEWNEKRKRGKYRVMLASRFQVSVEGDAESMNELKGVAAQLDLQGLQRRGEG